MVMKNTTLESQITGTSIPAYEYIVKIGWHRYPTSDVGLMLFKIYWTLRYFHQMQASVRWESGDTTSLK